MKRAFLLFASIIISNSAFGQKGFPLYYEMLALNNRADSLYKAKDFRNAAHYYDLAAAQKVEKAVPVRYEDIRYNAACSWALGNEPDSAFSRLEWIATQMNYANVDHLVQDADLFSLHNSDRWKKLVEIVQSNSENARLEADRYQRRTTFTGDEKEIIFYPHTEYMRHFLDNDSLPFISVNYGNFRMYFRGNSYSARHVPELEHKLSVAFDRILTVLDTNSYHMGINLILLDSAGELQQLTGYYVHGGMAMPGQSLAFFVFDSVRRGAFEHELFHYIANDCWHYSTSRLLNEGSAVYTDLTGNGCYYDNPIYSINAYMRKEKKLLSFDALINDFDNRARENEVIAYLESAAIFKYLYEQYGIRKMKRLWVEGFTKFENIYGFSISQLENEWMLFISKIAPPANMDWNMLMDNGCG